MAVQNYLTLSHLRKAVASITQKINNLKPDWNAKAGEEGYIANRTHWKEEQTVVIAEEQTIQLEDGEANIQPANGITEPEFSAGDLLIITLNGTTYELEAMDDGGEFNAYVELSDANDTYFWGIYNCGLYIEFYGDMETPESITISITKKTATYYQLDNNYLDGKLITSGTGKKSEIFNDVLNNIASGYYSHAEGSCSNASGSFSHVEGRYTKAQGSDSHAEGNGTHATGMCSHSEGSDTRASGYATHAEGYKTYSKANGSHSEGGCGYNSAQFIHLTGDAEATTYTVNSLHPEAKPTSLIGSTVGDRTNLVISETIVDGTVATITLSSTLSYSAVSNKSYSLYSATTASGISSHVEGFRNTAEGTYSHAEGTDTRATGIASHTEGISTVAGSGYQHVIGKYNVIDSNNTYAEIVGNGSTSARSNARTLDWSGNERLAGSITLGAGTNNEVTLTATQVSSLLALLNN